MSFCKATGKFFNASEGIKATNQFGVEGLYSPYAEFHYCGNCGKRLVTDRIESQNEKNNKEYQTKRTIYYKLIRNLARNIQTGMITISQQSPVIRHAVIDYLKENNSKILEIVSEYEIDQIVKIREEEFKDIIKDLTIRQRKSRNICVIEEVENKDSNDEYICDECIDKYSLCDKCGSLVRKNELNIITREGTEIEVCDYCLEHNYEQCGYCGEYIDKEYDSYSEVDGESICECCLNEHYVRCEGCNEYILNEDSYITDDNHYFCGHCYHSSNYVTTCDICGRTVAARYVDEIENEDGEYEYICQRCMNRAGQVIHSYGYKPKPKKHGRSRTKEYAGIEIEVDGNRAKALGFLQAFNDEEENDIYLKSDGSVCGFEIVTHPMTRKYFYNEFVPKLEKGMSFLRKNGFRGHNKAGIHIHISTEAINEDMLKKMMILMYPKHKKVYKIWLKITQRRPENMHWCSMNPDSLKASKKYIAKLLDDNKLYGCKKKPELSDERYTAINCRNRDTIEFRIFNSNIRTERIIKNMQVVYSLIDFTKTDRMPTMSNYLKFIENNSKVYPELYDFLIEKEILQPKEQKEKIEELMNVLNVNSINGLKESLTSIQEKQQKIAEEENLNEEDDERNEQCA